MPRVVERSIKTTESDPETRQEVDLDFLGSGYLRKVFISNEPGFHWQAPPQRPRTSVTLVPIPVGDGGFGRLIYEDLDGQVRIVELRAGRYYYIPPYVPYQIEARGSGVLEVYSRRGAKGPWFDQEALPNDYFQHRSEAGGEGLERGATANE